MNENDQEEVYNDVDEPVREMPEESEEDDTREVINTADHPVTFRMDGSKIVMKPLEIRRIHKSYATPRQLQPNAPALPSTVEHLTGNKVYPIVHEKARSAVSRARAKGLIQ